ncbi:hypothetical protein GGR56DRAFT_452565 [Xylariaceae sp. FL0804]|nr:hypothetical protein GGR56DRAFT_452565 [Xylariaceae sp. FL0804]
MPSTPATPATPAALAWGRSATPEMPSTTATPATPAALAWAVKFHAGELGWRLEAYITLQPTFHALRLCNRFGRGERASIARLPSEAITAVEKRMFSDELARTLPAWQTDFRCYRGLCRPEHHFVDIPEDCLLQARHIDRVQSGVYNSQERLEVENVRERLQRYYERQARERGRDIDGEIRTQASNSRENPDDIADKLVHNYRELSWVFRTLTNEDKGPGPSSGLYDRLPSSVFVRDQDLIVSHFGLRIWVTQNGRRHEGDVELGKSWDTWLDIVYLGLPGAIEQHGYLGSELDGIKGRTERALRLGVFLPPLFPTPFRVPPPVLASVQSRFQRMTQILGLGHVGDEIFSTESRVLFGKPG